MAMQNSDAVQFARMIAEIRAVGLTREQVEDLKASTDLSEDEIENTLKRAEDLYEEAKDDAVKFSHLTPEQRGIIFDKALQAVSDDMRADWGYANSFADSYLRDASIQEQVELICTERDILAGMLPFDPETGKDCFMCYTTSTMAEIHAMSEERGLHKVAYWNKQDDESYRYDGKLAIRYGCDLEKGDTDREADRDLGHEIVAVLKEHGVEVEWDGSPFHVIYVIDKDLRTEYENRHNW
jgi:hypothetical protein